MRPFVLAIVVAGCVATPVAWGQGKLLPPAKGSQLDPELPSFPLKAPTPREEMVGPTLKAPSPPSPAPVPPPTKYALDYPRSVVPLAPNAQTPPGVASPQSIMPMATATSRPFLPAVPPPTVPTCSVPAEPGKPAACNYSCDSKSCLWAEVDYLLWWIDGGHATGNTGLNDDGRSGAKVTVGAWLDDQHKLALQVGGFWLADPSERSTYGETRASMHSSLSSFDVAIRDACYQNGDTRVDVLVGYRQLRLADRLNLTSVASDTENEFFGAEVGLIGSRRFGDWTLEGLAKLSAGWNVSHVATYGTTRPGSARLTDGTLIPEVNVGVAYDGTRWLRLRAGYSFLYWQDVYRPGDQIDAGTTVRERDIFIHGVNVGVELRY